MIKYPQLAKVGGCWSGFHEQQNRSIVDLQTARHNASALVKEGLIGPTIPAGGVDPDRARINSAHIQQPVMFQQIMR